MGIFDFFKHPDIHRGVEEFRDTPGAVLVDVRNGSEYAAGHIPGSCNVPLQALDRISAVTADRNTPLFIYCYSGARSAQATAQLQRMGYTNVKNIGGIAAWNGSLER